MKELTILEKILVVLKKNKDGLKIEALNDKYIEEYGTMHSGGYHHLCVLRDRGLVEARVPPIRDGKKLVYFATEKAWEEERKEKALEQLKEMYELMSKKMDFTEVPNDNDLELIKNTMELK